MKNEPNFDDIAIKWVCIKTFERDKQLILYGKAAQSHRYYGNTRYFKYDSDGVYVNILWHSECDKIRRYMEELYFELTERLGEIEFRKRVVALTGFKSATVWHYFYIFRFRIGCDNSRYYHITKRYYEAMREMKKELENETHRNT